MERHHSLGVATLVALMALDRLAAAPARREGGARPVPRRAPPPRPATEQARPAAARPRPAAKAPA
ncbi:hypothetical protein JYK14_16735 [Siccirubricoccus sp. KC 17139]|uniref:Uncharacterized protein n=1 Tax=Siccirubricoccus soli TaxID=2899147 RepID=A0ABT1D7B0_9PROT|nr:hypothetical protein [Siccirubricoccus soli]MCO6417796.1 hypothetical protein [Siccirubricoccus soli]MCP2683931.1 hypothetical protein [Siccirubricoccus soli]